MSKKIKVKYDEVLTIDKLYNAFYRSRKGRSNKREIVNFELNLGTNIVKLYDELASLTYKPSPYKSFVIYEGVLTFSQSHNQYKLFSVIY